MIVDDYWWEANDQAERLANAAAEKNSAARGFADAVAALNLEANQAGDEVRYRQLRSALSSACTSVDITLP
ncbi:hypothetical protein AB0L64_39815 [Kribbella sp. NPDC051936]|uniref:hypothetical protein n=1 Tax=Kribbella sp. NPDC051936 TaxID=3154946 RepID=UPI0034224A79